MEWIVIVYILLVLAAPFCINYILTAPAKPSEIDENARKNKKYEREYEPKVEPKVEREVSPQSEPKEERKKVEVTREELMTLQSADASCMAYIEQLAAERYPIDSYAYQEEVSMGYRMMCPMGENAGGKEVSVFYSIDIPKIKAFVNRGERVEAMQFKEMLYSQGRCYTFSSQRKVNTFTDGDKSVRIYLYDLDNKILDWGFDYEWDHPEEGCVFHIGEFKNGVAEICWELAGTYNYSIGKKTKAYGFIDESYNLIVHLQYAGADTLLEMRKTAEEKVATKD